MEKRAHNFKNLTGQVFERLTALNLDSCVLNEKTGKKKTYWKCVCICGKICVILSNSLVQGTTKSCGCLSEESKKRKRPATNLKDPGEISWSCRYSQYRTNAKSKNLEFFLSKLEFKELCSKNCFYCQQSPQDYNIYYSSGSRSEKEEVKSRAWIKTNGVDRISNSNGYTLNNVRASCTTCNLMKSTLGEQEFYQHIEKLYKNLVSKQLIKES